MPTPLSQVTVTDQASQLTATGQTSQLTTTGQASQVTATGQSGVIGSLLTNSGVASFIPTDVGVLTGYGLGLYGDNGYGGTNGALSVVSTTAQSAVVAPSSVAATVAAMGQPLDVLSAPGSATVITTADQPLATVS